MTLGGEVTAELPLPHSPFLTCSVRHFGFKAIGLKSHLLDLHLERPLLALIALPSVTVLGNSLKGKRRELLGTSVISSEGSYGSCP